MDAAIAAAAALIGVALGAVAEAWRDRRRRREDRELRATAAIGAFLAAAVTCDDLAWDVWHSARHPDRYTRPPGRERTPEDVGDSFKALMPAYYGALLVVPSKAEDLVADVYEHVKLYSRRLDDPTVSPDDWAREWRAHRARLIDEFRGAHGLG